MESIQDKINIIKDILKTNDNDMIIDTIKNINPIILMYYQMMDNTFKHYNDKLPERHFNFDIKDAVEILINIGDANFVIYIIKEFKLYGDINLQKYTKGSKIIENIVEYCVETNDINYLNILDDSIKSEDLESFNINYYVINKSIFNNNHQILENYLMDPKHNEEDDKDPDEFEAYICAQIMYCGDYVDIVRVFHEYSKKFPDFINFDFNLVFNAALVNGREKCMQYALNNSSIDYHYKIEEKSPWGITMIVNEIYPFTDTIMYAIMGKNINCVQNVFNIFMDKIDNKNWEEYFKFASVYGTLEIIQYMITLKPYLVEQIEGFYNNILKFALCEANIDIIKYAMLNGAKFSNDMHDFVKDYNKDRGPEEAIDEDYIDFYMNKYTLPENFNEKYIECIKLIHN
jgi:hypothetical protein